MTVGSPPPLPPLPLSPPHRRPLPTRRERSRSTWTSESRRWSSSESVTRGSTPDEVPVPLSVVRTPRGAVIDVGSTSGSCVRPPVGFDVVGGGTVTHRGGGTAHSSPTPRPHPTVQGPGAKNGVFSSSWVLDPSGPPERQVVSLRHPGGPGLRWRRPLPNVQGSGRVGSSLPTPHRQ